MTETVTLFGGSGFLGRHITRQLCKDGYRVRVAVRHPNSAHYLKPMGDVGQVQVMQANVKNGDSIREALAGADHVVNLVGILYQTGRQKFTAIQAEAPAEIARFAQELGVKRMIQMSAIGADPESNSKYAKSKGLGEKGAREAFPQVTILRPSVVFGPEDQFFNTFASLSRFTPLLPLFGGGKTKFQPVFVGDVALAVSAALKDPATQGKIYELGGPDVMTFKEVFQIIAEVTGRKRLLLPVPFFVAWFQGLVFQLLPNPLITTDQVKLLKKDNIVGLSGEEVGTLADLGIAEPAAAQVILPSYLWRFRNKGQFAETNV